MKKKIALIIFLIIIFFVLFLIIFIAMIKVPGIFMNLKRKNRNWIKEDIGKPFLDEQDIEKVKQVLEQVPITRLGSVLSTVGTPTYINKGPQYKEMAKESNVYMRDNFGWFYDKLLLHLEKRLPPIDDKPVKCQYAIEHDIALPGVHIFAGNSIMGRNHAVASLHVDLQEKDCPWPKGYDFDWEKTYSFTIPISMPKNCGLIIFNKKASNINSILPLCFTLRNVPRQKIVYEVGYNYLHHGKYFHLIAPFKGKNNGKYMDRISFQGHCLFCNTTQSYWIYW